MTNIYLITNNITNQKYVGKTIHTLEHRFEQHCHDTNNTYIDNAIKAYGCENFSIELLKSCEDSDWKYWETFYIKKLHSHWTSGGYNLSMGGDFNPMDDPEVRSRHAVAVASAQHREKQRIASTGRRHSIESRKKMSAIQKQIYSNPELRKKVCLSNPNRIPVKMLDDSDNVIQEFDSLTDVCRYFNKDQGNTSALNKVLDKFNKNGKRAKCWGHAWVRSDKKV